MPRPPHPISSLGLLDRSDNYLDMLRSFQFATHLLRHGVAAVRPVENDPGNTVTHRKTKRRFHRVSESCVDNMKHMVW